MSAIQWLSGKGYLGIEIWHCLIAIEKLRIKKLIAMCAQGAMGYGGCWQSVFWDGSLRAMSHTGDFPCQARNKHSLGRNARTPAASGGAALNVSWYLWMKRVGGPRWSHCHFLCDGNIPASQRGSWQGSPHITHERQARSHLILSSARGRLPLMSECVWDLFGWVCVSNTRYMLKWDVKRVSLKRCVDRSASQRTSVRLCVSDCENHQLWRVS